MDLFFFSSGIFLSSITDNSLIWVDYIYILSNTIDLTRSRNCLPLTFTLLHSQFLVGSLLLIFTVFGVVLVAHLYSFWWGPCCSSFLIFCVVCVALFVFDLCLLYPMLPASLDSPFLIVPSIFSNATALIIVISVIYIQLPYDHNHDGRYGRVVDFFWYISILDKKCRHGIITILFKVTWNPIIQ